MLYERGKTFGLLAVFSAIVLGLGFVLCKKEQKIKISQVFSLDLVASWLFSLFAFLFPFC